ncbi:MAG: hypothetical protein ACI9EF_003889 [Pseudohongiellaceae bacterium]|jgi:hypothetical protein
MWFITGTSEPLRLAHGLSGSPVWASYRRAYRTVVKLQVLSKPVAPTARTV